MKAKINEYASIALHVILFVAAVAISALVQFILSGEVSMTVTLPASIAVALASTLLARRNRNTRTSTNHGTE